MSALPPELPSQPVPPPAKPSAAMKWIGGGLCGCLLLILLMGVAVFFAAKRLKLQDPLEAVQSFVAKAAESSDAYKYAVSVATTSPDVQDVLGAPIKAVPASFSEQINNGVESDAFTISLSGPKGKGELRFEAERAGKAPFYPSVFIVTFENNATPVDLRPSVKH